MKWNFTLMLLVVMMSVPVLNATAKSTSLYKMYKKARNSVYKAPDEEYLSAIQALFRSALEKGYSKLLKRRFSTAGFQMKVIRKKGERFIIIREKKNHKRGGGFYIIREKPKNDIALEAPHSMFDMGTGSIAMKLFREGGFSAIALNTVQRYTMEESGDGNADMAHLDQSVFQAFTMAFAQAHPYGKIVQIHGFSKKRRQGGRALGADVIVSGGVMNPSPVVISAGQCLKKEFGAHALVFPNDTMELSAVTNTNAKALRQMGFHGFVHMELSAELRKSARKDREIRSKLMECVTGDAH